MMGNFYITLAKIFIVMFSIVFCYFLIIQSKAIIFAKITNMIAPIIVFSLLNSGYLHWQSVNRFSFHERNWISRRHHSLYVRGRLVDIKKRLWRNGDLQLPWQRALNNKGSSNARPVLWRMKMIYFFRFYIFFAI